MSKGENRELPKQPWEVPIAKSVEVVHVVHVLSFNINRNLELPSIAPTIDESQSENILTGFGIAARSEVP